MVIAMIFYVLATLTIFGLVLSYFIAYRLSKSLSILSLLLFLIMCLIVNTIISVDLVRIVLGFEGKVANFIEVRAILLFLASVFLFYTTWKVEDDKKIAKKLEDEILKNNKKNLSK